MNSMKLVKKNKRVRIGNLPAGSLFIDGETIALKSEYRTNNGTCECYIVGSGEMYWGGEPNNVNEKLVYPLELKAGLVEVVEVVDG